MCLAEWFIDKLRDYSRSRLNSAIKKAETYNGPVDLSSEVNRCVGWAIFEVKKVWKQKDSHDEESGEVVELLQAMSYTHQEAITNDEYMEKCYEAYDILLNLGKMTLVSPDFFPFATNLMNCLGAAITDKSMLVDGNECMRIGTEKVTANQKLRQEFMDYCEEYDLTEARKADLYAKLVDKACHARFGGVLRVHTDTTIGRQGSKKADMHLRPQMKALGNNKK